MSQTRLEARTHRPDVELCRDPPYHRLVEEVGQIQESLDLLNRKLNDAEHSHQVRQTDRQKGQTNRQTEGQTDRQKDIY